MVPLLDETSIPVFFSSLRDVEYDQSGSTRMRAFHLETDPDCKIRSVLLRNIAPYSSPHS